MFISIPDEFFVPVIYEYKENLNLEDNNESGFYRESKGKVETGIQYKDKVISKEYAEENKGNIYSAVDNEYVKEATETKGNTSVLSCNKREVKEQYRKNSYRRMIDVLDDEYARGFKR